MEDQSDRLGKISKLIRLVSKSYFQKKKGQLSLTRYTGNLNFSAYIVNKMILKKEKLRSVRIT